VSSGVRVITTPTGTRAPQASLARADRAVIPGGAQLNVATAAPGDPGYNGGRWQVHALSLANGYPTALTVGDLDSDGVLDSTVEIAAAIAAGAAVDTGVVKQFVCPAIPLAHAAN
jgi:hypothetical protein